MSDHKPGGSTPSQYGLPAGATELQDLIEYRGMNFALGNIFKACYRRGTCSHSDELRDMRKILWFAQREVDRLEAEEEARTMPAMKQYMKASQKLDGTVYGDPNKVSPFGPNPCVEMNLGKAEEDRLLHPAATATMPTEPEVEHIDKLDAGRTRRFAPITPPDHLG